MEEQPETIVHRWFDEVWNRKNEAAIEEMMNDETVHYGLGEPVRGVENFKGFYHAFVQAFPDLQFTIEDSISDGEKIAARYTARGTHSGEAFGIAPTNQPIEFTGGGICTVRDGKFIEVWNEIDFMKLYSQLGALPPNIK